MKTPELERLLARLYRLPDSGTCEHATLLARYISGDLDPTAREEFAPHLLVCADCSGAQAEFGSSRGHWRSEDSRGWRRFGRALIAPPALATLLLGGLIGVSIGALALFADTEGDFEVPVSPEPPAEDAAESPESAASNPLSTVVQKQGRAVAVPVLGSGWARIGDRVDVVATVPDPALQEPVTVTVLQSVVLLESVPQVSDPAPQASGSLATLLVLPEEGELVQQASRTGSLRLVLRNPQDLGIQEERGRATRASLLSEFRRRSLHRIRQQLQPGETDAHAAAPSAVDGLGTERIASGFRGTPVRVAWGASRVVPGDRVDLLVSLEDASLGETVTLTLAEDLQVLAARADDPADPASGGELLLMALIEEGEMFALAESIGEVRPTVRHPEDTSFQMSPGRATLQALLTGERTKALERVRYQTIQVIRGTGGSSGWEPLPSVSEGYRDHGVGGWVDAGTDALSTFGADVDTGSYTLAQRKLLEGSLPTPEGVRVEEFLNNFHYDYPAPTREAFSVHLDAAPSPVRPDTLLLRVGLQGRRIDPANRSPVHLTFLVDVSGSMQGEDRLDLAKTSLKLLVESLRAGDTVALVTYAGSTGIALEPTPAEERRRIVAAIEALGAGGSTAMSDGLTLAYDLAQRRLAPGAISRVIVLSDGDANVGASTPEGLLAQIRSGVEEGVTLTTVGFGVGNYQDSTMEQLADAGNGTYFYVDSARTARRVFVDGIAGLLENIAKDVKIQVELDTRAVARYRLLGYENRDIADDDFRNDRVDAGEIGAGHSVTALYEVQLTHPAAQGRLATVRLRWKRPRGEVASEREASIDVGDAAPSFEAASPDFRFATAVAGFAELLRNSADLAGWSHRVVRSIGCASDTVSSEERQHFCELTRVATRLAANARTDPSRGH